MIAKPRANNVFFSSSVRCGGGVALFACAVVVLQLIVVRIETNAGCMAEQIDANTTTSTSTPHISASNSSAAAAYSPAFLAEANDYNISNRVVDIFFFTQYCGPNSRLAQRVGPADGGKRRRRKKKGGSRKKTEEEEDDVGRGAARVTYAELDVCCRQHDNCANYITEAKHYELYPGLEHRNQYFARMECSCDGLFYQCLDELKSRYASTVAIGYGIVQSYCFEFEHPIVRCTRRSLWRCEAYVVDGSQPKRWQWFDVPPAYKKIFSIPRVQLEDATNNELE